MCDINSNDHYKILGVSRDADEKTIKKAYHRMAVKYHPDKNTDVSASNTFKKINEAYSVLSDTNKRRTYDQFGTHGTHGTHGMSGMSGGGFSMSGMPGGGFSMSGMPGGGFSMHQAHDIFNQFFAGARSPNDPLQHFFSQGSMGGFPSQQTSPRYNTKPTFRISRGTRVLVNKLKLCTQLNGEVGVIVDYSPIKKRYIVSIKNSKVYLKCENIQQIHKVAVMNLQKNVALNGKLGEVLGFDHRTKRYQVLIDGNPVALKQNNILFKNGSLVKLIGLKTVSENNKWVNIVQCEQSLSKYLVRTKDNKLLRVKYENILG